MCTDKLVKIGALGRRDFHTFEACDAEEASAVCDCLTAHAQKLKNKETQAETGTDANTNTNTSTST